MTVISGGGWDRGCRVPLSGRQVFSGESATQSEVLGERRRTRKLYWVGTSPHWERRTPFYDGGEVQASSPDMQFRSAAFHPESSLSSSNPRAPINRQECAIVTTPNRSYRNARRQRHTAIIYAPAPRGTRPEKPRTLRSRSTLLACLLVQRSVENRSDWPRICIDFELNRALDSGQHWNREERQPVGWTG